MPTSSLLHGEKYIPTPVTYQVHGQSITSESISPSPSRSEQKFEVTRNKSTTQLKKVPSKTKWSRKKKIIVAAIIVAVAIVLIITVVLLAVLLTKTSSTTTSTTQATPVVTAYWTFDAVVNDYYGVYNGTLMNSASYFATTSNQPFVGYGRGLTLLSSSSQYFRVLTPFLDLSYKSFTIEAWIYPIISSNGDYGIFTQYQCPLCSNQCLYLLIRNYRLYASFTNNDLSGNITLTTNTWYHIAFVYNNATSQQILYVNGVQDIIKSNSNPYQGINGTLGIGVAQDYIATSYFNGYIDNFKITTRAKSSTEILTAATLLGYFSFDLPNPTYDSGPNGLNGSSSNAVIVSGRVNQGFRFTGSTSYFQAYGFYQVGYAATSGKPFSVSLWISPSAAISSTIVQISPYLSTGTCHNLIGLFSYYGIVAQILVQGYTWPIIYGPMAPLNTWTHISLTYSLANGLTLYTNGVLISYTGSFTFGSSNAISYLQIGYYTSCTTSSLPNIAYQGAVDEVYVHSRELTQSDVTTLANP